MDTTRRNSIITSCITVFVAIAIALVYFLIRQNKYKKNKCYVDSIIETDKYDLEFEKVYSTENGRAAVFIEILVTNKTDSVFDAKFSDVSIKDDTGAIHKAEGGTLTIAKYADDYYYYGYYCDKNNDTTKYILHFKLNGKVYNVCFKNEPKES